MANQLAELVESLHYFLLLVYALDCIGAISSHLPLRFTRVVVVQVSLVAHFFHYGAITEYARPLVIRRERSKDARVLWLSARLVAKRLLLRAVKDHELCLI